MEKEMQEVNRKENEKGKKKQKKKEGTRKNEKKQKENGKVTQCISCRPAQSLVEDHGCFSL